LAGSLAEAIDRFFGISERGSSIRTEVIAGLTTFMTMAYILFVNPAILSQAGVPAEGVVAATALSAAIATLIMGIYARAPFALAPGMGLNSFFAFVATPLIAAALAAKGLEGREPWQIALAAVFVEGVIFILLSISGLREAVANSIPPSLKYSTAAGIGLFLTLIGLNVVDLVGPPGPEPGVSLNVERLTSPDVLLAMLFTLVAGALMALRVPGALILSIIAAMVAGWIIGVAEPPSQVVSPPEFSAAFKLDLPGLLALGPAIALAIVFTFFMVDFFDTLGTLTGLSAKAGFMDKDGRIPGIGRMLLSDAVGTTVGAALGTSTVTTYIESAAGIESGGRTGLTAVVVGILFLLGLVFTPILTAVPAYATAPALIIVGVLMMSTLSNIRMDDPTEAIPAMLILAGIPFTFSIADGMGLGFISYVVLKAATGRWRELNPILVAVAVIFAAYFLALPDIHAAIGGEG
jgi:AGZA family xanthine/uracil permease-like MFS transporter